jgi:hypothetical protein
MRRLNTFLAVAIFMAIGFFGNINTAQAENAVQFNRMYGDTIYLLPGEYFPYWEQLSTGSHEDRIITFDLHVDLNQFVGNENFLFTGCNMDLLDTWGTPFGGDGMPYHVSWIADSTGIWIFQAFLIQFHNNLAVGEQRAYSADIIGQVRLEGDYIESFNDYLAQTLIVVDGIKGDANGDGEISNMDVATILEYCFNPTAHLDWRYSPEGEANVGRSIMLFGLPSLLDGYLINLWLADPNDPLVIYLGIGQPISELYEEDVILSVSYETSQIGNQLTVTTDALAVMVSGRLPDGTPWQSSDWTSSGQVIFQIPEGVSVEDIKVEAVSIAGTEDVNNSPIITPTEFTLAQNYPNPFNPTTTIEFSLPTACEIDLSIYNVIGEKESTLANGYYATGYHNVVFDGISFSSGIYFYVLSANQQAQTKKMILVK